MRYGLTLPYKFKKKACLSADRDSFASLGMTKGTILNILQLLRTLVPSIPLSHHPTIPLSYLFTFYFSLFPTLDLTTLITGVILGLLIGMALMRILSLFEHRNLRKSVIRGSKNQILGELYEKILPALPDFPYAPKDMVFTGKGCDYIIFDGLTEGHLREVIFLELKSGNAKLSYNEAQIKNIIDHKRVRFTEYRINSEKR